MVRIFMDQTLDSNIVSPDSNRENNKNLELVVGSGEQDIDSVSE